MVGITRVKQFFPQICPAATLSLKNMSMPCANRTGQVFFSRAGVVEPDNSSVNTIKIDQLFQAKGGAFQAGVCVIPTEKREQAMNCTGYRPRFFSLALVAKSPGELLHMILKIFWHIVEERTYGSNGNATMRNAFTCFVFGYDEATTH